MILKEKYTFLLILFFYLLLLIGFFYGEDVIGGAKVDYLSLSHLTEKFHFNFYNTLLNYDIYGHRHSPILHIIKSPLFGLNDIIVRLIFLHLFLIIPFFFYKSLKIKFGHINKIYLKIFSCIILFIPTFRSYSIWTDPHLLGIFFFIISIFYFLKFQSNNSFKNALLSNLFLAISAYSSPNFGMFIIYYFYEFFLKFKFSKKIFLLILFNIIIAVPFFYYLFYLDINFIFNDNFNESDAFDIGENIYSFENLSNKLILIISILTFYLIPFLISFNFGEIIKNLLNQKIKILIILFIVLICTFFFDFNSTFNLTKSGGGFFYNISKKLFNNNYLLFFIFFVSLIFLNFIICLNKSNFIILISLILSHPQNTIWQSNFSPTIIFLILFFFNYKDIKILNPRTIKLNFIYYFLYLTSLLIYRGV